MIHFHRRDLIIGATAAFATSAFAASNERYAYVGCRTTKERNARGEGISVYKMDTKTGNFALVQQLKGIVNPSYLAFDQTEQFLYAVHGDFGEVSSYKIDPKTRELTPLNKQDCGGKNPVHLVPDTTNKFMLVANYATGTLGALPRNADGSLGALSDVVKVLGEAGPHKGQQKGIHPHQISYSSNKRFLIVPDKGGDKVSIFKFDALTGKFSAHTPPSIKSKEGAGPRHIAFHPSKPFAYLANELDSTIATYAFDEAKGTFKGLQLLPTTPQDFMEDNTAAGIIMHPNGKFVYLSNRGHDSVVTYAVNAKTELLQAIKWTPTQGKQPRFISLDPSAQFLFAANEITDTIVAFKVNSATGNLTPTGQVIKTGSPTCIIFSKG